MQNLKFVALKLVLSAFALLILFFNASVSNAQDKTVNISIVAKQYEFSPAAITVHKGDHVRLTLTSPDVAHGFAIDELNIDRKIDPKKETVIEFVASKEGAFTYYCSVYCGDGHPKMTGQLVVKPVESSNDAGVNVEFDKSNPGVAIVEANGKRLRIDTRTQTVTYLSEVKETTPDEVRTGAVAEAQTKKQERPEEPYDYHLINLPTPKRVPRHSLNLFFTHRFSEPIGGEPGETPGQHRSRIANDILGLDSSSVSSLGLSYGITDRLYAFVYRSPLCQPGLCKTIEIGLGLHLLDEAGRSPVALSVQSSIEGDYNFTERYTENLQAMVERSVTKYVHLFFSPAIHINANGQGRFNPQPDQFFPPSPAAALFSLGANTGSFGFGADARIRPSVSLMFEFTPRVGFKLGNVVPVFDKNFNIVGFNNESEPEIGFGIQKRIGRHVFSLTFSNTQTTTTSRYNSSNLGLSPSNFTVGFNIFRRLF